MIDGIKLFYFYFCNHENQMFKIIVLRRTLFSVHTVMMKLHLVLAMLPTVK